MRERWGSTDAPRLPSGFPGGAALAQGSCGWILIDEDPARRIGASLMWARHHQVTELHLLVESSAGDGEGTGRAAAGVLARRAGYFDPAPTVWSIDGRELTRAEATAPPPAPVPAPAAELYRAMFVAVGLEVVVEAGDLVGEVNGLEMARVPYDPAGEARLDVGIGRFDREAFAMMHPDLPPADALAKAAEVVRSHRQVGAARHPLNQLVPERWIRATVVADPARVGAARLEPVASAVPRRNLKETAPATAVGVDTDGNPLVVTFSSGVDLEFVPTAVDDRAFHAPGARLLLVAPTRDLLPMTRALVDQVAGPDPCPELFPLDLP